MAIDLIVCSYVYYMPENDVSEETYVSEVQKMMTVQEVINHGTKVYTFI